jgi:hypothetical protein
MKQLSLLSLILVFPLLLAAQDIEVPQTNKPLIVKYTASWCPNCGTWGWSLFRNLLDDNSEDALLVASHYSGNFQNSVSMSWYSNDNVLSQPVFFLNNQNQGATSGNVTTTRNSIRQKVQQTNGQGPLVQAGLRAEVDDANNLTVFTKTRFFGPANGEYYLGVYLVEKEFIGIQSGQGNNALHKQMLRRSLSQSAFGEQVSNGAIADGTELENTYSITSAAIQDAGIQDLASLLNGNVEIATIIWQRDGSKYVAVNTNSAFASLVSAVQAPASLGSFEVFPTPAGQQVDIALELSSELRAARLELFSAEGKLLQTLHTGLLLGGQHRFSLERGDLPVGMYILRLADGKSVSSRKVVFR